VEASVAQLSHFVFEARFPSCADHKRNSASGAAL